MKKLKQISRDTRALLIYSMFTLGLCAAWKFHWNTAMIFICIGGCFAIGSAKLLGCFGENL